MSAASTLPHRWWVYFIALLCFAGCNPGGNDPSTIAQVHVPGAGGGEGYGGEGTAAALTRGEVDLALDDLNDSRVLLNRGIGHDLIRRAGSDAIDLAAVVHSAVQLIKDHRINTSTALLHDKMKAALDVLFANRTELKKRFRPVTGPLYGEGANGPEQVTMRWNKTTNLVDVDRDRVLAHYSTSDSLEHKRQVMLLWVGHEIFHLAVLDRLPVSQYQDVSGQIGDLTAIGGYTEGDAGRMFVTQMSAEWTLLTEATRGGWRHDPIAAVPTANNSKVVLYDERLRNLCEINVDALTLGTERPNPVIVGYGLNGPLRIAIGPGGQSNGRVQVFEYKSPSHCERAEGALGEIIPYGSWHSAVRVSASDLGRTEPVLATAAGPQFESGAHVRLWTERNGAWIQRGPEEINSFYAHFTLEIGVHVALGMGPSGPLIATTARIPLNVPEKRLRIFNFRDENVIDPVVQFDPYPGVAPVVQPAWVNGLLVVTPVKDGSRHFRTFSDSGAMISQKIPDGGDAGVFPHTTRSAGDHAEALLLEDRNTDGKLCFWDPIAWKTTRCQ